MFPTLAEAARTQLAPISNRILAIRENGDLGYALAENADKTAFLLGVAYERTTDGWSMVQMATVPGWNPVGHHDEGIMTSWGYGPPGADRVRVEFGGEISEDEVQNGVYLLIWWRARVSQAQPFVQAFRTNGEWAEQQRPPSYEAGENGLVSVFEQPTQYFLHTCQWSGNVWHGAEPSLALALDTPDAKLGEAVQYLMTECRREAAPPDRSRKAMLALYKPARVRSWAALQRSAKLAHVWLGADGLRVEPSRNGGYRGPDRGFHFLPGLAERLERAPQPATLGAAVRRALSLSTLPPEQ